MSKFTPRPLSHLSLLILLGFAMQISGCATDSYAGDAEARTDNALLKLGEIRVEYDLPKDCPS